MSEVRTAKADVISKVCTFISERNTESAKAILENNYPFLALENPGRRWSQLQALRVFQRDEFTDRYTGLRLVFPGTLRVLSLELPDVFPFHKNWKTDACHFAYYELFPTIDHLVPVSRGGVDNETNWITTSMLKNAAKGNFTIEELGWDLFPKRSSEWDGLTTWFSETVKDKPDLLADKSISTWHRALTASKL